MRFFDQVGKAATNVADAAQQAMDRARFEAEKFQKTSRIQGELSELKQQLDQHYRELGQRTHELYRTGQIQTASVSDLISQIEQVQIDVTRKEDELRIAQAEARVESTPSAAPTGTTDDPTARPVPIQDTPAAQPPTFRGQQTATEQTGTPPPAVGMPAAPDAAAGKKGCPACGFQMPMHAVFCPNCGFRVGTAHLS